MSAYDNLGISVLILFRGGFRNLGKGPSCNISSVTLLTLLRCDNPFRVLLVYIETNDIADSDLPNSSASRVTTVFGSRNRI